MTRPPAGSCSRFRASSAQPLASSESRASSRARLRARRRVRFVNRATGLSAAIPTSAKPLLTRLVNSRFQASAAFVAAFFGAGTASAHLTYGGRDFGMIAGTAPLTISNQTVGGAFGWADGTDADWGDSHRGRFFRFTLTETTTVSITAARNDVAAQTGEAGVFLPGVSLYLGLGTVAPEQAGHDSSALSVASRPGGTEGSFRALADWSLGNDPTYNVAGDPTSGVLYAARLAGFTYIGNAVDGTSANYGSASGVFGDGVADGFVTGVFQDLPAGTYSFFVGGADHGRQAIETGPTFPTYGISVTVQAIPEPASVALMAGVAVLVFARGRRGCTSRDPGA